MRQWGHGHSIGVGLLGGLMLDRHVWTVALVCLLAGVGLGRFWATLAALGRRLLTASLTTRSRTPW